MTKFSRLSRRGLSFFFVFFSNLFLLICNDIEEGKWNGVSEKKEKGMGIRESE